MSPVRSQSQSSTELGASAGWEEKLPPALQGPSQELERLRTTSIRAIQELVSGATGLSGKKMQLVAEYLVNISDRYQIIFQSVDENALLTEPCTLRAAAKRRDRGSQELVVSLVGLSQRTEQGLRIERFPQLSVIPIEELSPLQQEIVLGRRHSRLLGARVAANNLTDEQRLSGASIGGNNRAANMSAAEEGVVKNSANFLQ